MADEEKDQKRKEEPIIIKKKKGHGGHGHHGGSWKVAYADFVTAMMAFFIVMWILASSEEVKKAVSEYFTNPSDFNFFTGKPLAVDLNLKPAGPGTGDEGTAGGRGDFTISFDKEMADTIVSKLKQQAIKDSIAYAEALKEKGQELRQYFKKLQEEKPEFKKLIDALKFEMTDEGLRIELIESSESLFFKVGSAKLNPRAVEILTHLAEEIGKLPNNVEIEGHTDSRTYSEESRYTNWELSTDRANTARNVLQKNGLWEGQITQVTGYADRKLNNPDNPFDISNRRVSILIRNLNARELFKEKAETQ